MSDTSLRIDLLRRLSKGPGLLENHAKVDATALRLLHCSSIDEFQVRLERVISQLKAYYWIAAEVYAAECALGIDAGDTLPTLEGRREEFAFGEDISMRTVMRREIKGFQAIVTAYEQTHIDTL